MQIERRSFLKGVLASGAFATAGAVTAGAAAADAAKQETGPAVLLVSDCGADEAFARGVGAARKALGQEPPVTRRLSAAVLGDPARLAKELSAMKGHVVIGLLGDADSVVFQEMLRDAGGRLLVAGQHRWGAATGYGSSHDFVTTPQARGVAAAVSERLGTAHAITESAVGGPVNGGDVVRLQARGDWAALTGEALARVASGAWSAGPVWSVDRPGATAGGRAGSAVSFVATL